MNSLMTNHVKKHDESSRQRGCMDSARYESMARGPRYIFQRWRHPILSHAFLLLVTLLSAPPKQPAVDVRSLAGPIKFRLEKTLRPLRPAVPFVAIRSNRRGGGSASSRSDRDSPGQSLAETNCFARPWCRLTERAWRIDEARMFEAIRALAGEILEIETTADRERAARLLHEY